MFHLREHLKLSTYLRSRDIWIDFKTRVTSLILDQEVPVFFEKAVEVFFALFPWRLNGQMVKLWNICNSRWGGNQSQVDGLS